MWLMRLRFKYRDLGLYIHNVVHLGQTLKLAGGPEMTCAKRF